MIHLITWRHRFHSSRSRVFANISTLDKPGNGPRIPAAPRKQDGKGAQYGLRKSQRCNRYGLLPELRQGPLSQLRTQWRARANPLRTMLDGVAKRAESV